MKFTTETARNGSISPLSLAEDLFELQQCSDAVITDIHDQTVLAVTGLPFYMPLALALVNDPQLSFINENDGSLLVDVSGEPQLYDEHHEITLSGKDKERISAILSSYVNAGGQLNEHGELILDLKSPFIGTHYAVNLLLGNREGYADPLQSTPKSVTDHFGRGSFRASREKQVLATRYELSPEYNGETANRQFYLTEDGKQIFYSLNVHDNVEKAYAIHGVNHTEIHYVTSCGLQIIRTITILPQEKDQPTAVELQHIRIINDSGRDRDLRLVVTGMFGITDPGTLTSDIIYANVVVESEIYRLNDIPVALSAHHQPAQHRGEKRFAMLLVDGEPMDEYCSSYSQFIGNGSLDHPESLPRLSNTHSRRAAAFFAMAKSFHIAAGAAVEADELVGMSDADHDIREEFDSQLYNLYRRFTAKDEAGFTFRKIETDMADYSRYLQIHTGEERLDSYLSASLPFQVLYQTYVSRSFAWTQKSYRETGFREIQDIYASMYYFHGQGKDALIRELLGSWIENVFEFGYAYHNFTNRGKEPGMCSDDQLWLIQAVSRYVQLTGDTDFLKQQFKVAGIDRTRSLLETMKAIIIYSGRISVGKHQLPLLDRADWNDALRLDKNVLEGPEKEQLYYKQLQERHQEYGVPWDNELSESVMNGCLLAIAAGQLQEMAVMISDNDTAVLAGQIHDDTVSSIRTHAWKHDWYARCLINDGRPYQYLGSTGDGLSLDPEIDGTYYLNSYSWTLLADIADEEQIRSMLNIIDRYLKTPAGLKLCSPVNYDLLDIVTGSSFYFPGDRENGGVFKHAAMMAAVASLKAARSVSDEKLAERLCDLARFMIGKTLPFTTLDDPFILKGNPRFCTQYNNSQTGENIGPILSGTASWLTLALYEVCGLTVNGDCAIIDPVVLRPHFSYEMSIGDTVLAVSIDGTSHFRMSESSRITLDGHEISARFPLPYDGQRHDIDIVL